MSKKSSIKTTIDPDEIHETPIRQNDITAGKLILRPRNENGVLQTGKMRVNMYLDNAVVSHFKAAAGERGYQTLINEALKSSIQNQGLETTIRRVLQQELNALKIA